MKAIIIVLLVLSVTMLSADVLTLINNKILSGTITGYSGKNIYIKTAADRTQSGAKEPAYSRSLVVGKDLVQSVEAKAEIKEAIEANATKYPTNHLTYKTYSVPVTSGNRDMLSMKSIAPADTMAKRQLTMDEQLTKLNNTTNSILISMWAIVALSILGGLAMANSAK
jgi:hypothetical protein